MILLAGPPQWRPCWLSSSPPTWPQGTWTGWCSTPCHWSDKILCWKIYEVILDFTADGKCQRNMIMMLMNVSKMRFTSFTSFPCVLCVFYKPRRILDMFVRKCCILSTSNISRMWGVMMTSTTLDLLVGGGSSSFSYSLSMQNWWEQWRPLPGAGEWPNVELTRYASPNIKT